VPTPTQLLFLPGASGNVQFWMPLAAKLTHPASRKLIGYPGFGSTPSEPDVNSFDELVDRIVKVIDRPTAVVAQSMGGVLASHAALRRPNLVTHLVFAATSGGLDVASLGAQDWRGWFAETNPHLPDWFATYSYDLSSELGSIDVPVLLLWGDSDPISPVAVGERLADLFPNATLHITSGGDHDFANTYGEELAPIVDSHLRTN